MIRRFIKRIDEYSMLLGIWIAKYVPLFFRPLKFWWADRMILACGYQERNGDIVIIYRPARNTREHQLRASKHYLFWKRGMPSINVTHDVLLKGKQGTMYAARLSRNDYTNFCIRAKNPIRTVFSRTVEQHQHTTIFQASHFRFIKKQPPQFFWENPADKDFWFSFLTIEDSNGALISGIYTRKESWIFNTLQNLPYYVHDPQTALLAEGKLYKAALYAVNRFNWVTHIDTFTFSL